MRTDDGDVLDGTVAPGAATGPEPGHLSDEQLVIGITRGRADALAEVYTRHGGDVFALASRVCGPGAAPEVTREVILGLWHGPEGFDLDGGGTLAAHLAAETHRRATDRARSDASRPPGELPLVEAEGPDHHALAVLPAPEREAIALAYFGGHTSRRVAELLGQPEDTVKRRIRRGLRQLRSADGGGHGGLGPG